MIDFEIHLTTSRISEKEIPKFEKFCQDINVKPILIELSSGIHSQQPMISKVIRISDENSLIEEVEAIELKFEKMNYRIIRRKIEVPYWHLEESKSFFKESKKYLEWHGKISIDRNQLIKDVLIKYGAHLSKNSLKSDPNRKFLTMRSEEDISDFKSKIDRLKIDLSAQGISIFKEELEYCIFDSYVSLDEGWIN